MNAIVGIGSQWGGTADTQIHVHWNETHYLPINDCLGGYLLLCCHSVALGSDSARVVARALSRFPKPTL